MFTIFDFPLKQWFPGLINSSSANMQPELRPTLGCPAYKDGETGPWQGLGDSCRSHACRPLLLVAWLPALAGVRTWSPSFPSPVGGVCSSSQESFSDCIVFFLAS